MKLIRRIILLLVLLNTGLLYLHYSQAADAKEEQQEVRSYDQEIEIIVRKDRLHIRQTFTNLSPERDELVWPKNIKNLACEQTEEACSRFNEQLTAIGEGAAQQQSITYHIPLPKSVSHTFWMEDFLVKLKQSQPFKTIVHLSDETKLNGLWLNGLRLVGMKEMKTTNYYLFAGKGSVQTLYWQKEKLPVQYENDLFTVYGNAANLDQVKEIEKLLRKVDPTPVTVVLQETGSTIQTDRFIMTSNQQFLAEANALLVDRLQNRFSIQSADSNLPAVVASVVLEKPIGSKKAQNSYLRLRKALTEDEHHRFQQLIVEREGSKIDAGVLDKMLQQITGYRTNYFVQGMPPVMTFGDTRTVFINEKEAQEVTPILLDGRSYYPLSKLLTSFDYKLTSNQQSIYIRRGEEKYRFSLIEPFYVFDNQRHNLRSVPYRYVNGQYYFDELALQRIFPISIDKTDEAIKIRLDDV